MRNSHVQVLTDPLANNTLLMRTLFAILTFYFLFTGQVFSQQQEVMELDLESALSLAFENQPLLQQFVNETEKTDYAIKSGKSAWIPQLNLEGAVNRYFQQPVAIFPDFDNPESGEFQEVRTGVPHNANLNFSLSQNLLNNELFRMNAQASHLNQAASQSLEDVKIQVVVGLSKAFYEVFLAEEQVRLAQEDIKRQSRQLEDAKLQLEAGLTDNIDFKRATITLQNTQSQLYQYKEEKQIKIAALKYWLGMDKDIEIKVRASASQLEEKLTPDTLLVYEAKNRIEYQVLESQKAIQNAEISYQKRRFLPDVSAFYDYNFLFLSPVGSELFDQVYSFSLIGLQLNLPIFLGGKRKYEARMAALDLQNINLDQKRLMLEINLEMQEALSAYKNSFYLLKTQKSNRELAEEIYGTISLQYEQGIKNFLEVIQAETDLRTARINYLRSLFNATTAKIDLQKARGEIKTDY
ncbi:TolC family protein [Cyclobacterium plantarum]|uniref:TolC family protein n=1 Tax=Cyclobacterium plantarum TaxID=2716263 RepID=A0ABX0H7X3_9BACT|nr:TolC family protein [Cyclobacterium plantarum]NHE57990.1 TolC family protein [Cyclobacterium plantarum]